MKNWKEITKLDSNTKFVIATDIIVGIFNIYVAIRTKQINYLTIAILFFILAFYVYIDSKLMKGKDALIKIQEEHIKVQNNMIDDLFKKLNDRSRIVKLVDIKIPEHYTKPRKDKLKRRTEFFNKNKCFATPIVIDKETMTLLDGYTSYLIAKKYNFEVVQVEEV